MSERPEPTRYSHKHGTLGGYNRGCRCRRCRVRRAAYDRARQGREPRRPRRHGTLPMYHHARESPT